MVGTLTVLPDPAAVAQAVTQRFVAAARDAIVARGFFAVALAGGTTPRVAYERLARDHRDDVDWQFVRFYFGDERCVPPTDDQSNYKMAETAMLRPLGVAQETVYRMKGELPPPDGVRDYEELLRDSLGDAPVFDLILLGLGPDGHTASLHPGTLDQIPAGALVATTYSPAIGTHRLTLTAPVINAARQIVLATEGTAKANALHAVLEGERDPNTYPAQLLDPKNGTLEWIVDRAAAANLAAPRRA